MANRSIQQKILKMKRRNRFAKFSGAVTKFAVRLDTNGRINREGKTVEYVLGPVSLSKQVISTGRGPDASRIAEYYNRVRRPNPRSLAEIYLIQDSRYQRVWDEIPPTNRITLVSNELGRLDMIWHGEVWFLVDLDYRENIIRRSRDYGSKNAVISRMAGNRIQWVESLPLIRDQPASSSPS